MNKVSEDKHFMLVKRLKSWVESWKQKAEIKKAYKIKMKILSNYFIHFGNQDLFKVPDHVIPVSYATGLDKHEETFNNSKKCIDLIASLDNETKMNVATGWFNFGEAWKAKGENAKAKKNYEAALGILQSILPDEHPKVKEVKHCLEEVRQLKNGR